MVEEKVQFNFLLDDNTTVMGSFEQNVFFPVFEFLSNKSVFDLTLLEEILDRKLTACKDGSFSTDKSIPGFR